MRNFPNSPSHIVLVGPMGAGKSSIGRLLAKRLQRAFVDLDAWIEAEAGVTIASIFSNEGEAGFRSRECRALRDVLMNSETSIIATGGGAVLDETNRSAMRDAGSVVYLQIEPAMQLQRLQGDCSRPLFTTANPSECLTTLQATREALYREVAEFCFDTTSHSPESAADALATLLEQAMETGA